MGAAFFAAVVSLSASTYAAAGSQASAQTKEDGDIQGNVIGANGQPVEGAVVRACQPESSAALEVKSSAAGDFRFPHLAPGVYVVYAQDRELRSADKVVTVSTNYERLKLVLLRQDAQKNPSATANGFAEAMEFADNPSFSLAGVTDWTAAGGHGSDVILRTSEALVRAATRRDPDTSVPGGVAKELHSRDSMGEPSKKEGDLRTEILAEPNSFEANRKLGEFYLDARRFREALGPLEACYRIDPGNRANERDLALALKETGRLVEARAHIAALLSHGEEADLHRLAGDVEEGFGNPMGALNEFETAVRLDPSEENFFAWGSELLLHRAILQAREVFARGAKAYPGSIRMLTALGAALFSSALYDEAALRLCDASDLDPDNAEPYLFMGQIVVAAPNPLPCVTQKLKRFLKQEPENPLANYFYAMATWKQTGRPDELPAALEVETLLKRAVALDAKCAVAWLQLGTLSYARRDYGAAVDFFKRAVEADPNMSEAHYKLGLAYDRAGNHQKAQEEFALHGRLDKQQKDEVERQRHEIKQFRLVDRDKSAAPAQQP